MTSRINGCTKLAGVIGQPLDHTLSPAMHNAVYKSLDLDWVYLPLPIKDDADLMRFLGAARVLPFVGFNITMPFKQSMLSMCDEVAMMAQMAGAVNAVHVVDGRFIGYNTDGRGLLEALEHEVEFTPAEKNIAIIGAGGAAGAAAVAFILGRTAHLTIANRSLDKAEELVERLIPHARTTEIMAVEMAGAADAVREADLIVNATPLGMSPEDPRSVPTEWIHADQIVCDMIYRPAVTPLISAAREVGATAINGLGMLVAQGAISIDIWSDSAQITTPRDTMRQAALDEMERLHYPHLEGPL